MANTNNTTATWITTLVALCVLSAMAGAVFADGKITLSDAITGPLSGVAQYYGCMCCCLLFMAGSVGRQPIVGKSWLGALGISCCIGAIVSGIQLSQKQSMKKKKKGKQ